MYKSKEQEMREEAKAAIIEALRYGYTGYYCDLHDEVFNTNYYIIGTYKAKKALEEYDVFKAIEKIQTYEKDNFGEIYTDLSDPEKLVNMLFYIIGEEVLWEMLEDSETLSENWDNRADEETNAAILVELAHCVLPETVFLQGDNAVEALSGNCKICNEPLLEHYELDAFGNIQMYAERDHRGDLVGFLCPSCAIMEK